MADNPVDDAVKTGVAVGAGGVAGGTIVAPLIVGGLAALGVTVAAPLALPVLGVGVLLGMWGGKKIKDAM